MIAELIRAHTRAKMPKAAESKMSSSLAVATAPSMISPAIDAATMDAPTSCAEMEAPTNTRHIVNLERHNFAKYAPKPKRLRALIPPKITKNKIR